MRRVILLCSAFGLIANAQAYVSVQFRTDMFTNDRANDALDGDSSLADHWYSQNYDGAVGELGLNFADQSTLSGVGLPNGTYRGDTTGSDQARANQLGLFGYCIASDDSFPNSNSNGSTVYTLYGYTPTEAETRYRAEVANYRSNSLMRAAYLMEMYGQTAHNATGASGDTLTAALQVAIWEVLYDASPNVSEGSGNYYVRTSSGDGTQRSEATAIRDQANAYLNQASSNNWGGANYDPTGKVMVWMDPTNANNFQSVITLAPDLSMLKPVPEASVAIMALGAAGLLFRRRR